MRVLFLRPEGEDIDSNVYDIEILKLDIFRVSCVDYEDVNLSEYEAIAFTSKNSVRCLKQSDRKTILSNFHNLTIYAIGYSTALEIKRQLDEKLDVKYPSSFTSEELANLIIKDKVKSCISFRSSNANSLMKEKLNNAGIKYKEIYDYKLDINYEAVEVAKKLLKECKVDVVVFTNSLAAKLLKSSLNDCVKIVSIGPVTSKELSGYNFIEAIRHDIPGVLEILRKLKEGR